VSRETKAKLTELLAGTARAHRAAFAATRGEDPDWAIWYADRLQAPLAEQVGIHLSRSRLAYCLMFVEDERQVLDPEASWTDYYADHLLERFAEPDAPARDRLALYYFPTCSYCRLVLRSIDRLGLDVDLRDIHLEKENREDLVQARGRSTVPVLRITSPGGEERWMPESRDIVRYLDRTYG